MPACLNLRRADFLRGLRERGMQIHGVGIRRKRVERHRRADTKRAIRRSRDLPIEVLDVDEPLGLGDVILHQAEQVHPAGKRQDAPTLGRERRDGLFLVCRVDVGKSLQSVPPARSS